MRQYLNHQKRAIALAAVLAGGLCLPATVVAGVGTIVLSGTDAPDSGGSADGQFFSFEPPSLNESGEVSFVASVSGSASDEGVFLNSGGVISQIARNDQAIPGDPATFYDSFTIGISTPGPALNTGGTVGFLVTLAGANPGRGIYTDSGGSMHEVVRDGGGFSDFSIFGVNADGDVAFDASVTAGKGIYQEVSGTVHELAVRNGAAPGGGTFFGGFGVPSQADGGHVAFTAQTFTAPSTFGTGVFRSTSGAAPIKIARVGDVAPEEVDEGEDPITFRSFGGDSNTVGINNSGQAAFSATLENTPFGFADNEGVYISDGTTTDKIARRSEPIVDGSEFGWAFLDKPVSINNSGEVAFIATVAKITDPANTNLWFDGIYVGDETGVSRVVQVGDPAPGTGQLFNQLFETTGVLVQNQSGQVMFEAKLFNENTMTTDDIGIFVGDPQEVIPVAFTGQALEGSTITNVDAFTELSAGGHEAMNDSGQVAFQASLADGRQGLFLFTPEVHWRNAASGDWDERLNWTVGIAPNQLHDTFIDPEGSVVVSGSALASKTVKSLTIGSTVSGTAELRLAAGTDLTVLNGVEIQTRGKLGGDGEVTATVTNSGGIVGPGGSAGTLLIDGDYGQDSGGTFEVELGGTPASGDFDVLQVTGSVDLSGTIQVSAIDGFDPLPLDEFEVLTYGSRIGASEFGTVDSSALAAGLIVMPNYGATALVLSLSALPGDANLDGDVDLIDLVIVAGSFDTNPGARSWGLGDFNADGFVDADDLGLLQGSLIQGGDSQFLSVFDSLAASLGVDTLTTPEPATMVLLGVGVACLGGARPGRRRGV